VTDYRGLEHDRIGAEVEMDLSLDSGDASRIEAAQAALDEAVAVHEEAMAQAQAEAEDPEPEPEAGL
jgi:hypothetical protein